MVDAQAVFQRLAIPAYEKFTSDGTDGNSETLALSHDLVQSPVVEMEQRRRECSDRFGIEE